MKYRDIRFANRAILAPMRPIVYLKLRSDLDDNRDRNGLTSGIAVVGSFRQSLNLFL